MLIIPLGKRIEIKKGRCCAKLESGRCTGSANCTACTTCNYCKYCVDGRTCGVCSGKKNNSSKSVYNKPIENKNQLKKESSTQCQAKTKSGTRCSRSSRTNGFCWQHGG